MNEPASLTRRILLWVGVGLGVLCALWFAAHIPRTLTVFVIAALIAFGVHPVTDFLERKMSRPLAIAVVYLSLLTLVVVIALLVVPATVFQLQRLVDNAPEYIAAGQRLSDKLTAIWVKHFHTVLPQEFDLQRLLEEKLSPALGLMFNSVGTILVTTMSVFVIGLSALILSFYFLLNADMVSRSFLQLFPPERRVAAHGLTQEIARILGGFIAGQFVLCTIVGISVWVVAALLGFHYALLVGVLSGFGYAIPFVGMFVAQLVAVLLASTQGLWMVVWLSASIFVIARIADNVLVPKIMSESVGVSPIGVMFAVFAGGELFGFPGLVLGIPAAALIKVMWKFFMAPLLLRVETVEPDFVEPLLEPFEPPGNL